ncbi:hypothetical protein ScPMuIL_005742 [Solemya velum]
MSYIDGKWFREENEMWAGYGQALEIEEVLYEGKSQYQQILVFKSKMFGNVLALDGVIQCTEKDECVYQEMIVHLPLNCHPNPKKVLVIGGGDGGVVREVVKHDSVESVVLCEIDEKVVEVSKKFLPHMAEGFDSPKLTLFIGDGIEFMKKHKHEFDVIITDSSDPIGPAEGLFQRPYYINMKEALSDNGIVCCQGENLWLDLPLIEQILTFAKEVFPKIGYAYSSMPTYIGGQIGYILCSKDENMKFQEPVRCLTEADVELQKLQYYNTDVHRASFVLPQFARKVLEPVIETERKDT